MNDENIFSKTMALVFAAGAGTLAVVGAITLSIVVLARTVGPTAGQASDSKTESSAAASRGEGKPTTPASDTKPGSDSKTESKPSREAVTQAPKGSTRI